MSVIQQCEYSEHYWTVHAKKVKMRGDISKVAG